MGDADRKRLTAIATLLHDETSLNLATVLAATFPGVQRKNALASFRQFRERLRQAAREAGLDLELCVDTQTRAAPDARHCWFEGSDGVLEAAADFARSATNVHGRAPQDAIKESIGPPGKRLIRVFVSYAHGDGTSKADLLSRLRQHLGNLRHFTFEWWDDGGILPGTEWTEAILSNIQACDIGLLLVSPAFLASEFITKEELPYFVPAERGGKLPVKPCVPVALKTFRMDSQADLRGLEGQQIIFHPRDKAFLNARTDEAKNAFVCELRDKIVQKVCEHPASRPEAAHRKVSRNLDLELRDDIRRRLKDVSFVPTEGRTGTMAKFGEVSSQGERQEAIRFLTQWTLDEEAEPCCALLGDTGVGKTTTCMALTQYLLQMRESDPKVRMPIYLDLRLQGEAAASEPNLRRILNAGLRANWRSGSAEIRLDADEVIRMVQEDGALIIFDGLDEVLVNLPARDGQRFTRELLRILPPSLWPGRRELSKKNRPGRILITCRTHYFRTLRDQQTHFLTEDRDDVRREDYRVFILLPFTDAQIRAYLLKAIPEETVEHTLATIRSVHNLSELATRPYTLSLIAHLIPDIERWRLQGHTVTGASIYRHMIRSWLERDTGKHHLTLDHKQEMMEYLAAALSRSGKRAWDVGDVEQWLLEFIANRPDISLHYPAKNPELLKEDLRTATFLVREENESFLFAHSSLQEFFLAAYLLRALNDGRITDWEMDQPSVETLDFLGQLMQADPQDAQARSLRLLRDTYRRKASELAFRFALFAQPRGYPAIPPAEFKLDGADLRGWLIEEADREKLPDAPRLNLSKCSFQGARLRNFTIRDAILDNCDFTGADLTRAEFDGGRANDAEFGDSDLTGTVFRDMDLKGASFSGSHTYRTQFLRCKSVGAGSAEIVNSGVLFAPLPVSGGPSRAQPSFLTGPGGIVWSCAWSPDGARIASGSNDNCLRIWDARSGECLSVFSGHSGGLMSCAWSPDGARIISSSADKTLRIWDVRSGRCLSVLSGHGDVVMSCTWSADGTRVASGSNDNSLRIWDAHSGKCLSVLRGHGSGLMSCAWSPDGARIASGSKDNSLRIWDTSTGECLSVLNDHWSSVWSCTWSPDGTRIASGSSDESLRIWDADSGECLFVLGGHDSVVWSCAWSPDGMRIVSSSHDDTLRVWDARSGECLFVLRGHGDSVMSCAWSPDSARIVSGSDDATLRIWDAHSGECLSVLSGRDASAMNCAWSPDGARIVSGSDDNGLRIWDAHSGECLSVFSGHGGGIWSCAWSPDGARIASASNDSSLRIWDALNGECLSVLSGHGDSVMSCAWSPDAARIVSGSDDGTLRIWDVRSGECLSVLSGHNGVVTSCAWSPDSTRIVSGSNDETLRIWDALSDECLFVLSGHDSGVRGCAWSPDGTRVVSGSDDDTLRIWDARGGGCLSVLSGHGSGVRSCAWSPNGMHIVSGANENNLRIWDAHSGECLSVLSGYGSGIRSCAWSPDGARIVSGSYDNCLRIWEVAGEGRMEFEIKLLPDGNFGSLTLYPPRIVQASQGAWRWIGWLVPGSDGYLNRLPAEAFGTYPIFGEKERPRDRNNPAAMRPSAGARRLSAR